MKYQHKIFLLSIAVGLSAVCVDAVVDFLFFYEGTFLDQLILNIPRHEIYIRSITIAFFILLGFITSRLGFKRMKIEEKLKESEEKYRALFDGHEFLLYLTDDKGTIMLANKKAATFFGLTQEEIIGKSFFELRPDRSELYKSVIDNVITTKKTMQFETLYPAQNENKWLFVTVAPLKIKNEWGLQVVTQDITDRKKAEEELHQYEQIVSSSTDMMALLDTEYKYLSANKAYMDAFNLTLEKLAGQTVSDIFGDDFFKRIIKPHAEKCLSGEKINYQDWVELPAHGKSYLDITYSPYAGPDSKVMGFVVNARNITDRKKVEDELINSNFWLEESQRVSRVGSYLVDIPREEWTSSKTLNDIYGISASYEKNINNWIKIVHPEQKEEVLSYYLKESLQKRKPFDKEYRIIRINDGEERWVHGYGELILDENNNPIKMLGTVQDITERKKAKEILEKSQQELKRLTAHLQTVREEERTLVAHELHDDIGQALTAIKMDIFMLEKKLPTDNKDISDQIKETKKLLDKTIQTTKKIYTKLRPTLLEHFTIKEVLEDQLKTFTKQSGISSECHIDLEETELDEKYSIALYRIVQEALNNIKWHSKAKSVNIQLKKKKDKLELNIKDNGIGIKQKDLNKSEAFGILGMKERTSFLGGEIEFKGISNRGTTVRVTFPIKPENSSSGHRIDRQTGKNQP